jgi:hypothetical protein
MNDCPTMIQIGDLCWDKDKKVFGVVGEILNHVYPYVIHWNDGRKNWVDYLTAYGFRYRAWNLNDSTNQ